MLWGPAEYQRTSAFQVKDKEAVGAGNGRKQSANRDVQPNIFAPLPDRYRLRDRHEILHERVARRRNFSSSGYVAVVLPKRKWVMAKPLTVPLAA